MFESLLRIFRSVRRTGSGKYLLLILVSFAFSVSATRVFLNLTGFPQIGSGKLHIAHVLWGGFLLYGATLLPLLYANRWVYPASAILSGLGIGLFMDEVGKFITSANDYFYPPAAPLIYSFFMISALLYTRIRRNKITEPKASLYKVFDMLEEVLEKELDPSEKEEMLRLLTNIQKDSTDPEYAQLAASLSRFVNSDLLHTIQKKTYLPDRFLRFCNFHVNRFFKWIHIKYFTAISLILLGFYNILYPLRFFLFIPISTRLPVFMQPIREINFYSSHASLDWLTARVTLEGMVGLILVIAGTSHFEEQNQAWTIFRLSWHASDVDYVGFTDLLL